MHKLNNKRCNTFVHISTATSLGSDCFDTTPMISYQYFFFVVVVAWMGASNVSAFRSSHRILSSSSSIKFQSDLATKTAKVQPLGRRIVEYRKQPLRDLLGLGPAEIALTLVAALVLFGPETLKSLSKDFGKAAAELKEIPKTFKEGMDEGAESVQVSKMKALAAEKRKKRDEKKKSMESKRDEEDDEDEADD